MDPICYLDPMRSTDMLAGFGPGSVDAMLVVVLVLLALAALRLIAGEVLR